MPSQRTKRVPPEFARTVFERLNRTGELGVLVAFLQDHRDAVDDGLRGMLARNLIRKPEDVADFQKTQGALDEVDRIIVAFETLGTRHDPGEIPLDDMFSRPPINARARSNGNGARGRL